MLTCSEDALPLSWHFPPTTLPSLAIMLPPPAYQKQDVLLLGKHIRPKREAVIRDLKHVSFQKPENKHIETVFPKRVLGLME